MLWDIADDGRMAIAFGAEDSVRRPALTPSFKAQMEQRLKGFPTVFPVIDQLLFDSRNWLWIRRGASEDGVKRDFLVMNPVERQLR